MKKSCKFMFLAGLFLLLASCESSISYSKLLEQEEKLIESYIARQGIEVLETFPADSVFQSNQYYHYPDGIYIQLISKGEGEEATSGRVIVVRFKQSTLDEYPTEESYWTCRHKRVWNWRFHTHFSCFMIKTNDLIPIVAFCPKIRTIFILGPFFIPFLDIITKGFSNKTTICFSSSLF